jgi:hypothetical protein
MRFSWSRVAGLALAVACARSPKAAPPAAARPAATTLSATEAADQVRVIVREKDVVYRAPNLSSSTPIDLRRGGPTLGSGFQNVDLGQLGFIVGVRDKKTNAVRHVGFFQSDFVEGTGRYASITLAADGRQLPFRVVSTNRGGCQKDCLLVYEAIEVELPDDALRNVSDDGLAFRVRLDNGHEFTVRAPAPYVRGYLIAVDRPVPSPPR